MQNNITVNTSSQLVKSDIFLVQIGIIKEKG
jgi:hypothetical protein